MKLTIHKQLGDTAIDTDVEDSIDDCLKVIDHLDAIKDNMQKADEVSSKIKDEMNQYLWQDRNDIQREFQRNIDSGKLTINW